MTFSDDIHRARERGYIVGYAGSLREKLGQASQPSGFGLKRRSNRDLDEVLRDLAELQARYDEQAELKPRDISLRAALLVLPLCGPSVESRARVWWQYIVPFYNASAKTFPKTSHYTVPKLSIRLRRVSEFSPGSSERDNQQEYEYRAEVIGRAVVQEYREQKLSGRASLESAWQVVADRKVVDGIHLAGSPSVRRYYKAFRRIAFEREYADHRAITSELDSVAWPEDQVWLADFP